LSHLLQERVVTDVQIEGASEMVLEELKKIPGVSRIEAKEEISDKILRYRIESERGKDICGELNVLAFRNQWILREIQPMEMSLEEIFFKMVAKKGKSQH